MSRSSTAKILALEKELNKNVERFIDPSLIKKVIPMSQRKY
jgi:hypothetical protein